MYKNGRKDDRNDYLQNGRLLTKASNIDKTAANA